MAFAHVARDEQQKLDSKAIKCIFHGYGTETKGYWLYDLKHAKVVQSRDVFNELNITVEEPETSEKQVVQLDGDSDEEVVEEPVVDDDDQTVVRRSVYIAIGRI